MHLAWLFSDRPIVIILGALWDDELRFFLLCVAKGCGEDSLLRCDLCPMFGTGELSCALRFFHELSFKSCLVNLSG